MRAASFSVVSFVAVHSASSMYGSTLDRKSGLRASRVWSLMSASPRIAARCRSNSGPTSGLVSISEAVEFAFDFSWVYDVCISTVA